jgi:hypothetical protein
MDNSQQLQRCHMTHISPGSSLSIHLNYVYENTQEPVLSGEQPVPSQSGLRHTEHVNVQNQRSNFFLQRPELTSAISTKRTEWFAKYPRSDREISDLLANDDFHRWGNHWDTSFLSETKKYSEHKGFPAQELHAFAQEFFMFGFAKFAHNGKAAFLSSAESLCTDFRNFLMKASCGRKLKSRVSENFTEGKYTLELLFDENHVRKVIAAEPALFGLPKNPAKEDIDKVIVNLRDKKYLEDIDEPESTGVLLEYGEQNSLNNLPAALLRIEILKKTQGKWDQESIDKVFKENPDIEKAFHEFGGVNTARTLCQIVDCMKQDDVRPTWFRMWDSEKTTELAKKDMEWVAIFNKEMRAQYEIAKKQNPELPYIDFLIDATLDAIYEK